MTFKPAIWFPIAVALSAINLVGVGFAVGPGESLHAATHAALALVFGLWAQRLRRAPRDGQLQASPVASEELEALAAEVSRLRQEVSEMQERLDFAERLLARGQEPRREGPAR